MAVETGAPRDRPAMSPPGDTTASRPGSVQLRSQAIQDRFERAVLLRVRHKRPTNGWRRFPAIPPRRGHYRAQLRRIEPQHVTAAAVAYHDAAWTIVGMRLHRRPAERAQGVASEFLPVQGTGWRARRGRVRTPALHHQLEGGLPRQDAATPPAKAHGMRVQLGPDQAFAAYRARILCGRIRRWHAVCRLCQEVEGIAALAEQIVAPVDVCHGRAAVRAVQLASSDGVVVRQGPARCPASPQRRLPQAASGGKPLVRTPTTGA